MGPLTIIMMNSYLKKGVFEWKIKVHNFPQIVYDN